MSDNSENADYALYQIGRSIRFAREKNHYTQKGLAEKIKGTQAQISKYERGGDMHVTTLIQIAKALHVNPAELLKEIE